MEIVNFIASSWLLALVCMSLKRALTICLAVYRCIEMYRRNHFDHGSVNSVLLSEENDFECDDMNFN